MINEAFVEDENSEEISKSVEQIKETQEGNLQIKTQDLELKEIQLNNNLELNYKEDEKVSINYKGGETKLGYGWSWLNITVEPIRFAVFFISAFTNGLIIDLMELNVCIQKFDFTYEECKSNLSVEMKTSLQSDLATVVMVNDLVRGIFPVALVLFLGPWSDRNGRKPWLLWVLRGFVTSNFLWLVLSMLPTVPLICFVIPGIPLSLSGGLVTINICTWSYVCDIFNSTDRPFRFSIFSMVALVGTLVGNLMAAEVFDMAGKYGYQVVFSLTTMISLVTLIYTTLFLKETITASQEGSTRLFDLNNAISVFKVLLIKPKGGVIKTGLVLITLTMEISARLGDDHLAYLVGKSEFSWKLRDYNFFASLTYFIQALVPVPSIWFLQDKLKLHNHVIIIMAGFIMFFSELGRGLAGSETFFWVASCFLVSGALLGPNNDTELSKCVSEDDLGKACAFVSLVDAMSPLVTVPVYTRVYQWLLYHHRTLYTYLVSAGLSAVLITTAICLFIYHRLKTKKLLIFREENTPEVIEKNEDKSAEIQE